LLPISEEIHEKPVFRPRF